MPDTTQPVLSDDFCTIILHFTGEDINIDQQFPAHLSATQKAKALNTVICKLTELYNECLSARTTP